MLRFLVSAAFWGAVIIRGRRLLEGENYSDLSFDGAARIREHRLFEFRSLLEKIRHVKLFLGLGKLRATSTSGFISSSGVIWKNVFKSFR